MNDVFTPLYSGNRIVPHYPRADMPSDARELWEYFSGRLGWGALIHSRITFDFLMNARAFAAGRPVLDAGAGHQRYKPFFGNATYLSQEHPAGIEFKQMRGIRYDFISPIDERIPIADGAIACVINTSVIEHVRHPERFLKESHRVLCPGGRLYTHVPFAYCEHEQPYDFQRPTRYGLRAWLQDAGFTRISVLPSSNSVYGSSAFLFNAMRAEFAARGIEQQCGPLLEMARRMVQTANEYTDDYVDISTVTPIGWIAVAEKDGVMSDAPAQSLDRETLIKTIVSP
jgi:SAM-dependent methyltransferase